MSAPKATPRKECKRCEQFYSYGTGCISRCKGSAFSGPGWRDPLHEWQAIAAPTVNAVDLAREVDRLTKVVAAWKALAQAERRDHGASRFGSQDLRNAAFAAVQEALDNLRALGINPDAP